MTTTTTTTEPVDLAAQLLDQLVEDMTAQDIAHQLVVAGIDGADVATRLSDTIGTACLGGVFVTESHGNWAPIDDPAAATATIDNVRQVALDEQCVSPPLVMTDAELGEIVRVPVTSPQATRTYGDRYADSPSEAMIALYEDAFVYATALAALGIDVNFGAVADVDTAPEYFMARSGRTFGTDPKMVAALATEFVWSHCDARIAAALKHFPNQGATLEDPHKEPSVAVGGVDAWRREGFLPYVDTRAPMVMTGHIFMDIDPAMPATMSHPITTGLLREELGYGGVIVTDDLSTMRGAIDVVADAGDRAVAAISAGADLVLFVRDTDVSAVASAILEERDADPAFAARARESVRRVVELKAALGRIPTIDAAEFELCG